MMHGMRGRLEHLRVWPRLQEARAAAEKALGKARAALGQAQAECRAKTEAQQTVAKEAPVRASTFVVVVPAWLQVLHGLPLCSPRPHWLRGPEGLDRRV